MFMVVEWVVLGWLLLKVRKAEMTDKRGRRLGIE
jgi:hypothetical protein